MRVVRLDPRAALPSRAHADDAGLDLRALDGGYLRPYESAQVPTGIAIELYGMMAGLVVPRSGVAANHAVTVTNSPGLIDPGYRGEIKLLLSNLHPWTTFQWEAGDRLAQLLVVPFMPVSVEEATELSPAVRGDNGLGSSGVK